MSGARTSRHNLHLLTLLAVLALGLSVPACKEDRETLLVSVASSLAPALREIADAFEARTGIRVLLNIGASGRLVQQIEQGAPVDVFLAADGSVLDDLEAAGRIEPDSRYTFAQGYLSLWPAREGPTLRRLEDLAAPEIRRVAIAHPVHAPYGNIARQALETAGLWPTVESKIIVAESVEQAFQYAEEGHVDAALVAVSVLPEEAVGRTVPVPEALYSVLSHELAVIEDAPNPSAARQFVAFMEGVEAHRILRRHRLIITGAEAVR